MVCWRERAARGVEREHDLDLWAVLELQVHGPATHRQGVALRAALMEALASGSKIIRVDLSGVEEMDTAALAVLVEILMEARKQKLAVHLCRPSAAAERVFQLASFVRMVSTFPSADLDQALRRCSCADEAGAAPGD